MNRILVEGNLLENSTCRKRRWLFIILGLMGLFEPICIGGQYGPETCKQGYVWREATGPNDHVCVLPATAKQAAEDNSQYAARRQGSGPYGADTCRPGYVWREASGPQDHVCVLPATRDQAAEDNAAAASRFQNTPVLWDVLTQHNDSARTGAQLNETTLTPSNVSPTTFGRIYERYVDGQVITQPLYVSNQWIPGTGLRNVVYVAARTNWIYAFDADDTDPNPLHGSVWTAPVQIEPDGLVPNMCSETHGPMGVTSTPVIDRASDTMYVVARKSDGTIWLHALDIATGQPKQGTPGAVQIQASMNGINFDQTLELNRAGLLFDKGAIFLAFGALNCDNKGWHGWVLAYRAPDLTQVGAFVTTQSGDGGGVWQSGNGLASDGAGNIYFNTGNGPASGDNDLGENIVKLHVGDPPFYGFTLAGHYRVSNYAALNKGDTDLGSGGPLLLPGGRLISGGKQGKLYVFDRATMTPTQNGPSEGPVPPGGSDGFQGFVNTWHDDPNEVACTQTVPYLNRKCYLAHHRYEDGEAEGPNIHGGPVYWDGVNPSYGLIYGMPEKDFLRAFSYDHSSGQVSTTAQVRSTVRSPDGMPGSPLSLSANANTDGVIWASIPKSDGQWQNVPGRLVAFDALTLQELWRDDDDVAFAKFTPVTVAGGKVFRPTFANKLIVYGLTNNPAATPCYDIAQKYENYTGPYGILGDSPSPETVAPDGIGHFQNFQGGSIYWTPSTCAWEVHGSIRDEWSSLGWEKSVLGYPVTDESVTSDVIGRYNDFQYGSIYWTPLTGAHEVHGTIRNKWMAMGAEQSVLGYPVSDEIAEVDGGGRFSLFEHGSIHSSRTKGVYIVTADSGVLIGPAEVGVDRPGSDITSFNLPAANPAMCQVECADNNNCRAWTYVNPGVQGPVARCWLKGTIPLENASNCCVSGIKVDIQPSNTSPPQGEVDRPGFDFAGFALPDADFHLCQGECASNSACRAWAYAEPSNKPPTPPRCWLKDASPAAAPKPSIISGSK
jgi:hypothetical protein